MNELKIFENEQFGQVRTMQIDGEPWFVASDVCRALGLEQVTRAMDRLDDDERGLLKVTHPQSLTKTMDVNAVNEPGLYHLVLCSNKPEAKAFKRWITHDVIPNIRKTGGYIYTTPEMTDVEILSKAILIADAKIKERDERIKALEDENKMLAPKAAYCDAVLQSDELLSTTQVAKDFGISARKLNSILHIEGIQYCTSGKWHLYQTYANKGLAANQTFQYLNYMGYYSYATYLCWTQKGRVFIQQILAKRGIYPHTDMDYVV